MEIGLVGMPNAGKSTLFNALTRHHVPTAPYPFTTIEPHRGVVSVPDPRLEALARMIQPERIVPATLTVVDIAGLVRNAHQGEGLGNQFLAHIREVDAILMVLRGFDAPNIPSGLGEVDPIAELEVLDLELALADLETVRRRLEKTRKAAKADPHAFAETIAALEDLAAHLQAGRPTRTWPGRAAWHGLLRELFLLTDKPRLILLNVAEEDLPEDGISAVELARRATKEGSPFLVVCAELEAALNEWSEEEARAYRESLGLSGSALDRLVQAAYAHLGLITFFTITGGHEVRAWPIPRGTRAQQAAGRVHSDMERGFIRAEVIPWHLLVEAGSPHAARERGLWRIEGRDYEVQDGDVLHFRFHA